MTIVRALVAMIALIVAGGIAAACDDTGGANTSATNPTEGASTAGAPEGQSDALTTLLERFRAASFRAEYEMSGGADAELEGGVLVIYKDGADRLRIDVSAEQDGETVEIILLDTPTVSAFCLRNAGEFGLLFGIDEGDGVCFGEDAIGLESQGDLTEMFEAIEAGDFEVIERSQREIAGEPVDCFRTRDPNSNVSELCLSDQGYLLAASESDGATMEATRVAGEVEEADFDPPYELRDLPGVEE